MGLVAEHRKAKLEKELIPIRQGIELHSRALVDLKTKEKNLVAAYNTRGFELIQEKRRNMGLEKPEGAAVVLGLDGLPLPLPILENLILIDESDTTFKRLREDLDFTRGEIVRIEQKLQRLSDHLKTQEAQLI